MRHISEVIDDCMKVITDLSPYENCRIILDEQKLCYEKEVLSIKEVYSFLRNYKVFNKEKEKEFARIEIETWDPFNKYNSKPGKNITFVSLDNCLNQKELLKKLDNLEELNFNYLDKILIQ